MAYVAATPEVPREVIAEFAAWVVNMGGPTHTQLNEAILRAGLDVPEAPNKPSKVRNAFEQASPAQGRRLVEELIDTLRSGRYWTHNDFVQNLAATQRAIRLMGGTVSDDGFLTWDYSPGDVIASQIPAAAPPIYTPRTTLTVAEPAPPPPPPLAQAGNPRLPSHEHLLWLLRRVPESIRPLIVGRREGKPTITLGDEYDLQDAVEVALRLNYNDVRPEERSPSLAGGSTTPDFVLPAVRTAIEVKVTKPGRANRHIRDEILVDTETYRQHPDAGRQVFVVYDIASTIQNPAGFETDLTRTIDGVPRDVLVVRWATVA